MAIDQNFNSRQGFSVNSVPILTGVLVNTTTFTSNGTYTKSANLIYAEVTVIGAGGSGLSTVQDGGNGEASPGGTAGATAISRIVNTSIRSSEPVIVGIAIANSAGTNSVFGNTSSTFTEMVGGGGAAPAGVSIGGGTFEPAPAASTATGGDINIPGGQGDSAHVPTTAGGQAYGGRGGDSLYGRGGGSSFVGVPEQSNGNIGTGYGGGGGGAATGQSGSSATGGKGSNGVVIIVEYINT